MARQIFDRNPDPADLLDELYRDGVRDFKGLPLGNVTEHAQDRLIVSYQVLCLFAVARDLGLLPGPVVVEPTGSAVQDRQTSGEFQAAHVLPSDLMVTPAAGSAARLHHFFRDPFSRVWMQRNVFGRTDRVHRLTNLADSYCEAAGMRRTIADACAAVVNNRLSPMRVFENTLAPGYAAAARTALQENLRSVAPADGPEFVRQPLLDRFGKAAIPRPTDTRVGSPNAEARLAARRTLNQVLEIYAGLATAPRHLMVVAAGQVDALRGNEVIARR